MNFLLSSRAVLSYRVGVIRDGKRKLLTKWRDNLILDSGLDKMVLTTWCGGIQAVVFGNQVAPDPVRRDSNPITFSTVGTTCTASGSFFTLFDVGRLIKFNDGSGQELYIAAFTNVTTVTLLAAPSPAISANTATVWYVNQTALQAYVVGGNIYGSAGGDNGTTAAGSTLTHKRTIIASTIGANTTLTEIGFSGSNANINLFDRDIIIGGIAVLAGDQPFAVVTLAVTISPTVPTAVANVATGFNSAGTAQVTCFAGGIAQSGGLDSISPSGSSGLSGAAPSAFALEPSGTIGVNIINAAFSIPAFSSFIDANVAGQINWSSGNTAGYVNGSFTLNITTNYDIATGNGNVSGFSCKGGGDRYLHKLTTPFTKSSSQTLSLTYTKNWQRTLVN